MELDLLLVAGFPPGRICLEAAVGGEFGRAMRTAYNSFALAVGMTTSQKRQGIPTSFNEKQFEQFVLPHLTVGRRGPAPKLPLH